MIARLSGKVLEKHPNRVIVDVAGVGYDVQVPLSTFYGCGDPGAAIALRIHTHVREDQLALFGFATDLELAMFEKLIAVSGIGPKLALSVLSGIEPRDLVGAIQRNDLARLTAIPGVGKKTAERICVELRDRLPKTIDAAPASPADSMREDLVSALANLGYHRQAIDKALDKLLADARRREIRRRAAGRAERSLTRMTDPRILTASRVEDDAQDEGLRPKRLDDYIGQDRIREQLQVAIEAAKQRGEALDHTLLYGPPGLGKTTLAYVIANELGVPMRTTAGPVIEKPGDLAGILSNLQPREVLFIDEIHRMAPAIEEILYPAMEDFELDIVIGQGPGARSVKVPVEPFTLVGATTRAGLLTSPLRARFGIVQRLNFYSPADIEEIGRRSARILGVQMDDAAAKDIASRSRGTPRIVNRLLRRVRDYAQVRADGKVTLEVARAAMTLLDVDEYGFDESDRRLLLTVIDKFSGGPVGLGSLAAALSEEADAIEDIYEPYLIQSGFLERTPRGRLATARAYEYFGRTAPGRGLF